MALRGWGRDEFQTASPEFMDAVRWGLFAERLGPVLSKWEEIQDREMHKGMSPRDRRVLGRAKLQAAEAIAAIKAVLYPEDDEIV